MEENKWKQGQDYVTARLVSRKLGNRGIRNACNRGGTGGVDCGVVEVIVGLKIGGCPPYGELWARVFVVHGAVCKEMVGRFAGVVTGVVHPPLFFSRGGFVVSFRSCVPLFDGGTRSAQVVTGGEVHRCVASWHLGGVWGWWGGRVVVG